MAAPVPLPHPLHVLVVDDDYDSAQLLGKRLRELGCTPLTAATISAARQCLSASVFDLIIAELHLPQESGLDLLRWVATRAAPERWPVILITGRPSVETAIQALRDGAADYLQKPIVPDELARALGRVSQRARPLRPELPPTAELSPPAPPPLSALPALPPNPPERRYQIGPVLLDLDRFVLAVNGQSIDATPSELEILHYLCRHPNRVVTPQELVQKLRGYPVDERQAPELIRPHISNLRRKLQTAHPEADIVLTVRGVGYMLRNAGPP